MDNVFFEWDEDKNLLNIEKHGISFYEAQKAFLDVNLIIEEDLDHSTKSEVRYYCYGKIDDKIVTIRFTYRKHVIRIFGAGYWRQGKKKYEKG